MWAACLRRPIAVARSPAVRKHGRIICHPVEECEPMVRRKGIRRPNPCEQSARERLEPILGPLREIDPRGGPRPLHDFEADLPGGAVAAIEVTGQVDAKRLEQASSARRRFSALTLPGSKLAWQVALDPYARVKLIRSADLRHLLHDMEVKG